MALMESVYVLPQFKIVYIFLEYFFQNISQIMLPSIYRMPVKTKQLKRNKMNKTDKHNINLLHSLQIL